MMTDISKMLRIIKMPLAKRVLVVNKYIHDNGLKEDHIRMSDVIADFNAEAILNKVVYQIMTPHKVPKP